MKKIYKRVLVSSGFKKVLYRLIRLYSRTFRLSVENEAAWLSLLERGERVLICTWHQQFFSAIRHFKKYHVHRPSLMISQSLDGEIIAGVARLTGWRAVRGSSSRGGKDALKEMIRALKNTGLAAHIVDGPRGPAGVVKAGVIRLAMEADAFVVPFYVEPERAWFFNSWDRFFIPKPFSRVTLRFGSPFKIACSGSEEAFEARRRHLESVMRRGLRGF